MVDLKPNDIVKSCKYIEMGSYFGIDGVRFCVMGTLSAPMIVPTKQLNQDDLTYEMVVERRGEQRQIHWGLAVLSDWQGKRRTRPLWA